MIIKVTAAKINIDGSYEVQERESRRKATRDRPTPDCGIFFEPE